MPKVSGSVTVWFENVEFEDDGKTVLRDQAHDALTSEVFGEIVAVEIDHIEADQ